MKDEREFAISGLPISNRKSKIANLLVLITILLGSFILKLNQLGHPSLKPLDEAFHAVVARNMLAHPLWPTLNEGVTIPTQPGDWQNGAIWLHKPPMAMWQIVISFKTLGISTFSLRLPSAILSTAAALLTYLIGLRLMNPLAGLIAAGVQAFNPAIVGLVHGYVFSDHVDVSLLFWTELSIYFLVRSLDETGVRSLVICGIAQGLAFLSKTYPALIVTGLAAVAWGLPSLRMNARRFGIIAGAMLLTILPWTAWALYHWPELYVQETLHVLRHLTENIEDWAAPWDRLPFDHWVQSFNYLYPAVLAGVILTVVHANRTRDPKLWLVLAWAAGVAVPHLLSTSKPPVATLIGWPAMWLMLGYMVGQAIRGDALAMGAWLGSMVSPILLSGASFRGAGLGADAPPAGAMLRRNAWVIWHTLAAMGLGIVLEKVVKPGGRVRTILIGLAIVAGIFIPVAPHVSLAYRVTIQAKDSSSFTSLGRFIQTLPANAVVMVEENVGAENKVIQFAVGRTCYPVRPEQVGGMARAIVDAGGIPVLFTSREMEMPRLYVDESTKRSLYDPRNR